jgi:hypothetical protein
VGNASTHKNSSNVHVLVISVLIFRYFYYIYICIIYDDKAIDKLEAILNGGLRTNENMDNGSSSSAPSNGTTSSMFGPKEYVSIYT